MLVYQSEWHFVAVDRSSPNVIKVAALTGESVDKVLLAVHRLYTFAFNFATGSTDLGIGVEAFHQIVRWPTPPADGRVSLAAAMLDAAVRWFELSPHGTLILQGTMKNMEGDSDEVDALMGEFRKPAATATP